VRRNGVRRLAVCALGGCLLAFAGQPVFGLDWPVAARIVTGTFGEDRGDHFHNGVDIGGGTQDVHPVLPGELVFRYDEAADYSSLPRGVGTFIVLHHEQDILSVYAHLKGGSLGPDHTSYLPGERLGVIGETGHANGLHLHFSVFDEEAGSSVNPLAFLPALPDRQPPVIRHVFIAVGEQRVPLANGVTVKPGRVEILAEVYDLREDVSFSWPLAPSAVSVSIDGAEVSRLSFDSLQVVEGKTVVDGGPLTRDDTYDPEGLLRCGTVELQAGESQLRIAARDFAGNETVKTISFTVRE
jgi:Peptidase family M23